MTTVDAPFLLTWSSVVLPPVSFVPFVPVVASVLASGIAPTIVPPWASRSNPISRRLRRRALVSKPVTRNGVVVLGRIRRRLRNYRPIQADREADREK